MTNESIRFSRDISRAALVFSVVILTQLSVLQADTLKEVHVGAVHIQDNFWTPKLSVYRNNTIPHSLRYVEQNIKALRKLAGLSDETGKIGSWTESNLYKYMETCAYYLAMHEDANLEKQLDEIISVLSKAQKPDGYIHAYVTLNNLKPWGNLYHQHDGYVLGHMYEAAVAHYLATGKKTMLDVACKSADQAYRYFIDESNPGFPGHAEIELALVQLYRVTGEKRYLELAKCFIERRGQHPGTKRPTPNKDYTGAYFQDHLPFYQQKELKGHAVRAVFFATGIADVALETGDSRYIATAKSQWDDVIGRNIYITGNIGALKKHEAIGDDYVLPNNGYCESCAACGQANFAHCMLMLEADGRCGDVLEKVIYNAVLHGISLDGKSFYYNNPLSDKNHRRENNWCCCPAKLSGTLMKVGQYAYLTGNNGIYVNLYIGGNAGIALKNNTVIMTQETNYPWDGNVKIIVYPRNTSRFPVNLRIPGWCQKAQIKVNGKKIKKPVMVKGFARINRKWKKNDKIVLNLPMPVTKYECHPNVTNNAGLVAIQRGPIIYGIEALDNNNNINIELPSAPEFTTEYMPEHLGGTTVIRGKTAANTTFTAIPFYALANRAKSSQAVWLRQKDKKVKTTGWDNSLYREYVQNP